MKPGIIQLADRVLKYFVPGVLTIAALSFAVWLVGPSPGAVGRTSSAARSLRWPSSSSDTLCAWDGDATGPHPGRRQGCQPRDLMRSGDAFQIFPDVDHIVLDKTGTITVGEPAVSEVVALHGAESGVLATAASAEAFSEHPLADAILDHADDRGVAYTDRILRLRDGQGCRATVDRSTVLVGKPGWLEEAGIDLSAARDEIERLKSAASLSPESSATVCSWDCSASVTN